MSNTPISFFEDPKPRSLRKLEVYGKYLAPLANKLGSQVGEGRPYSHVWIVDAFAGAGSYQPDGAGKREDGSPLVAAKLARDLEIRRKYPVLRCINVEENADCFEELRVNLAAWATVSDCIEGRFETRVDQVLAQVGDDPVLFFLDPFGVSGIEMELLAKLRDRKGKTELLIHFSNQTFLRMAGHLNEKGERKPTAQKVAEAKLARLDALIGTPMWRRLWQQQSVDLDKVLDSTVELYMAELKRQSDYVHQINVRDHFPDRAPYRLIFCTDSPHGVVLMSDITRKYEADLFKAHEAGQSSLFAASEEDVRKARLYDAVMAEGLRRGSVTPENIIHHLAPKMFGEYETKEYNAAIRRLVNDGIIVRLDSVGIKPREMLKFMPPSQSSLLT